MQQRRQEEEELTKKLKKAKALPNDFELEPIVRRKKKQAKPKK